MIIVKNRELLIPGPERYIGTTYDTESENRQFLISRFAQNGVDLSALTFHLDLKYANDAPDTVLLDKEVTDTNIILTWNIGSSVLQVPGTLFIQLRAVDDEVTVKWSSFHAALYVERHLNTPGNYTGSLTEIEQMEQDHQYMLGVVNELKANIDYAHDAEAWAVGKRSGTDVPSTDEAYHNNSKYYKELSDGHRQTSERFAKGTVNGSAVSSGDGYHDNSKYYKELADDHRKTAEAYAKGTVDGTAVTSGQTGYQDNAKYYKEQVQSRLNQIDTNTSNIAVQTARIDQFTHLAEGSTTGDAELMDARVGADGVTYTSAGAAVRANDSLLKSALELNAGNQIVSGWTSGYYKLSSSATSVDISSPEGGSGYRCVYVPCRQGDVFYCTSNGTLTAKPYAFLSSASGENNIIKRASSKELSLENAKIIAPNGATYAVFNSDITVNFYVIKGELGKNVGWIFSDVSIPWEIGNIVMSESGYEYKYDRASRVRTPQGYSLYLHTGDIVGMTDYTDAEFYFGWTDSNNTWHYGALHSSDFTVAQDGYYVFLLRNKTEVSVLTTMSSLTSLFFVKITTTPNQLYTEGCQYSRRYAYENASGLNYHLFNLCSPKFAMHRGYSTLAPENTIPAFELAGSNGAWGIETDVYETSDGYFVCHHDSTVDRMTDGTGSITSMTLAQIEALTIDAGARIEDYQNLKIPTLEQYLAVCRRYGCVAFIEIKTVNNISGFMAVVKKCGMENNVILLVALSRLVPLWRYYTSAPIAYLGYNNADDSLMIDEIASFENVAVDFYSTTITSQILEKAHQKNMPVFAWTVDSEQNADTLFRLGVDVITTNSIPHFT